MLKNMKINLTDTSKIATFVCIKKARPESPALNVFTTE